MHTSFLFLLALPESGTAYRAEPCGADGKVLFDEVEKPSAATGFFTIGVKETPTVHVDGESPSVGLRIVH